jgi:hypothetical protein
MDIANAMLKMYKHASFLDPLCDNIGRKGKAYPFQISHNICRSFLESRRRKRSVLDEGAKREHKWTLSAEGKSTSFATVFKRRSMIATWRLPSRPSFFKASKREVSSLANWL